MSDTTTPNTLAITGAIVGVVMVSLLGFTMWALVNRPIPSDNANALLILIGALTTNVTAIVAFYYGASVGSRQKDTTIAQQATTAAKVQAAQTGGTTS